MNTDSAEIAALIGVEELLRPGARVEHFKVIRLLGRGGMGEVYLARDIKLGRKVALKVVLPKALRDDDTVARFLHEARLTAKFNHPHIVTIYAVGEHGKLPYVALEYLEGQTLRDRMDEERQTTQETTRICLAIAEALVEAHEHKVLHRDLKPENVLLPRDGRVRVVDFGLAKTFQTPDVSSSSTDIDAEELRALHEVESLVETDGATLVGTPMYMAPEQWKHNTSSMATDLWAFGVILYELLTGHVPFDETSLFGLCTKVCLERVPPLELEGDVSPDLEKLVMGCLEKSPDERPSAREVATTLRDLLRDRGPRLSTTLNPFRGLLPFTESQADFFFGRDEEVSGFVERLRQVAILPVVGPSGAGKSSFVLAGVIPRLHEQGRWIVLQLKPGNRPFESLSLRLQRADTDATLKFDAASSTEPPPVIVNESQDLSFSAISSQLKDSPGQLSVMLQKLADQTGCRVLLLVDQLEELFTLVDDEAVRRSFMEAICTAADDPLGPARVVFTLRDDFIGRVAETTAARRALQNITVLRSPDHESLQEILLRPLERVGFQFEDPELPKEMLEAVREEPACLPVLQFACTQLWQLRDKERLILTRSAYEAMGGVEGALATHTDKILDGLSPTQVESARLIFLRLVTPEATRRVMPRRMVLEGIDEEAPEVLRRLTDERAIVIRKGRAQRDDDDEDADLELVHESLIQRWDRLSRWLEESREDLTFLAEVTQAAELWERRGRRQSELWQAEALADARRALKRCTAPVPEVVTRFLELAARRDRQRAWNTRAIIVAAITILAIVSVVLALQKQELSEQKLEADEQRIAAQQRRAEALREGARAAQGLGRVLEARAKLRAALELEDSPIARIAWWRLIDNPLQWRRNFGATIYAVDFSPDGASIAAACQDRAIYLLDATTSQGRVLRGHEDQVLSLAHSHDGRFLASGAWDGEIRLWDLSQRSTASSRSFHGHRDGVWDLSFNPEDNLLASSGADKTIKLWSLPLADGDLSPQTLTGHEDTVYGVDFNSDGTLLASGSGDKTIRVWDVETRASRHVLKGHEKLVRSLEFAPEGPLLASASSDKTIRLWNAVDGSLTRKLSGHDEPVRDVAFSPDGQTLASGSTDKTVRLWNLQQETEGHETIRQSDGIPSVSFGPEGKRLVAGGWDKTVTLWDLGTPRRRAIHEGHSAAVYGLDFAENGRTLATASMDETARIWDVRQGSATQVFEGHTDSVWRVKLSPDGSQLATSGYDETIRIWSRDSEQQLQAITGHSGTVFGLQYDRQGEKLISVSQDSTVRLWDTKTGDQLRLLNGHESYVLDVDRSPNGELLATSGGDQTIRIWRSDTGELLSTTKAHKATIYGVRFTADGEGILSSSTDGKAKHWSIDSSGRLALIKEWSLPGRSYGVALHPDGHHFGVPCANGTGLILDTASDERIVLEGHSDEVNAVAFSDTGRFVATSSDDGTVRVWEAQTGAPYWRAPLLVARPEKLPLLANHQGWLLLDIDGVSSPANLSDNEWQDAISMRARQASQAPGSRWLCVRANDDRFELWDTENDRRLVDRQISGIQEVLGLGQGCAVRTEEALLLVPADGEERRLSTDAPPSAICPLSNSIQADAVLLAAMGDTVASFSESGETLSSRSISPGATAVTLSEEGWLILGFRDGNLELVPPENEAPRPAIEFEGVPSSTVIRLVAGPSRTLFAGYANGVVGIWSLDSGQLLHRAQLHGPVTHLLHQGHVLYAATDLGHFHAWNLGIFYSDHCELLREVWDLVPVVWSSGQPRREAPPSEHSCSE